MLGPGRGGCDSTSHGHRLKAKGFGVCSAPMKKRYTDVPFEVVKGPKPDVLPRWFKLLMFALAGLLLLGVPIWKFNESHSTAPVEAGAKAEPPAQPAR